MELNEHLLNSKIFKKMLFLYNCLENGWSIKKKNNYYIFYKKHHNKKEYLDDDYINRFIEQNHDMSNIGKSIIQSEI
jgi:hypothetical protein